MAKLIDLCISALKRKNIYNETHKSRLKQELTEIYEQNEADYFLDLYKNGIKYSHNENNLLIPFLLEIVPNFSIDEPPKMVQGDFPDIDVDYIKEVRDYLKDVWAPQKFGKNQVCSVGNYSTFGIKNSILDCARIYGIPRSDVNKITKDLELDAKQTWDEVLAINKDLAEFCQQYPQVAEIASKIVGRNKSRGEHAGGLIISNVDLTNFVPLTVDTEGNIVTAWSEGQHSQDLQPIGLIKYDLLVLSNLKQISLCCNLIKERHKINSINALPEDDDWSDISYLNDPKALTLASTGKLNGVFQFTSAGMQALTKKCGVDSFDDLMTLTALFRPACIAQKMHEEYILRKHGKKPYNIHPILKDTLNSTYGVLAFQEQVMKILHLVGNIPLKDCEILRKAISKKKVEIFGKYKNQFLEYGPKNLNTSQEEVEKLWEEIEAFSGYGFCLSHACAYTYVSSMLLWLKAYYPLEFFASLLACQKDTDKIKFYKIDAKQFSIIVNPIDINKSKETFTIVDDQIYIGFSNIKGIGEKPAARIVEHQPYAGLQDFLTRFGTESKVVKALIALGAFGNRHQLLMEYYEYFSDYQKKEKARGKRNVESLEKYLQEAKMILPDLDHDNILNCTDERVLKIVSKYKKSSESFILKQKKLISFDEFESKSDQEVSMSEKIEAEALYYGFSWHHPLEDSEDYDPDRTFSRFDLDDDLEIAGIQLWVIEKPIQKTSQKGNSYYTVKVEDANGKQSNLTIWEDDYLRFKEEFEYYHSDRLKGNFLQIRLNKPGKFNSYTMESPPRHLRKRLPEKSQDGRLMVLQR